MVDRYLDIIFGGASLVMFITVGGVIPLIASLLSILWFLTLFLGHIEKYHSSSFKKLIIWYASFFKKKLK